MRIVQIIVLISMLIFITSCTIESGNVKTLDLANQRVLIFAAHQDDETIGTATVMSRAIKSADSVDVVITTNGAPREFGQGELESKIRNNETIKALSLIGINKDNIMFLGYDDLNFITDINLSKEIDRIANIIIEKKPSIIFVQAYEGGHIDHDTTNYLVVKALEKSGIKAKIYEFPEYNAFGWGSPIPQNDSIQGIGPIIILNLTKDESSMKRTMLKQYISQNPVKKNLVKEYSNQGLRFMHLSVDVNDKNIDKTLDTNGYIGIGGMTVTDEPFFLTEYGYEQLNKSNPSQVEIAEYLLKNYKKSTSNIKLCENMNSEDSAKILEYDQNYYTCKELEKQSCEQQSSGYRGSQCDNLDAYLKPTFDFQKKYVYETLRPILNQLMDNYDQKVLIGNYYIKTIDERFLGTINVKPLDHISILIEAGNVLEEPLYNISISVMSNQMSDSLSEKNGLTQNYNKSVLSAKTMVMSNFVLDIPIYSDSNNYPLTVEIRGYDTSGKEYTEKVFLSINIIKKDYDLKIVSTSKDHFMITNYDDTTKIHSNEEASGALIQIANIGNNNTDIFTHITNKDIGIDINYSTIDECKNAQCDKTYIEPDSIHYMRIPLNITNIPPGVYPLKIEVFDNESNLQDSTEVKLYFNETNYTIEEYRPYNEFMDFLTSPEIKPEIQMSDCPDNDYMACMYYWPDMIRPMPSYNYSKPPHITPPVVGYERDWGKMNITFEEFSKIVDKYEQKT